MTIVRAPDKTRRGDADGGVNGGRVSSMAALTAVEILRSTAKKTSIVVSRMRKMM